MINNDLKKDCSGCLACYNACPVNAVYIRENKLGFKYPIVDKEKCIQCGLCNKVCPILSSNKTFNDFDKKAYAVINLDEEVRLKSSSGGVFSLIAKVILNQSGVVFGAKFDDEFNVVHTYIENEKELDLLRGSKYVQSYIGNTYVQVKKFLEEGRKVLFTGTPCQIDGLNSFLGKEYDNLYMQDLICHGVPSSVVWKKYLEYRKQIDDKEPINIYFRDKAHGWRDYEVKFDYASSAVSIGHKDDAFMKLFLSDLCLRDSCYSCKSKGLNKVSDITLADFWGIRHICEELYDNKGTSLVIINSKKGEKLFNLIKDYIEKREVDLGKAIEYNMSIIKSSSRPEKREEFIEELENLELGELVKKYILEG